MGFGFLTVGYVFLLDFFVPGGTFDYLPNFIGYIIMLIGLMKLSVYNRWFRNAKILLYPLIPVGVALFVYDIIKAAGIASDGSVQTVFSYIGIASALLCFAFHIVLLKGIIEIAKETELTKISSRALRNLFVTMLYYFFYMTRDAVPADENARRIISLVVSLFGVLVIFLNTVLIISCYMRICLEGDEDMPVKPSRFKSVNRFNSKIDRALEKLEKSGEESARYRQEKKSGKKKRTGKK